MTRRRTTQPAAIPLPDILADLRTLAAQHREDSESSKARSTSYQSRCWDERRGSLKGGANVHSVAASRLDAIIERYANGEADQAAATAGVSGSSEAPAVVGGDEAADGTVASGSEPADQDTGSLDVSGLRSDHE